MINFDWIGREVLPWVDQGIKIVPALFGLYFFGFGLRSCRRGWGSAKWPSTTGEILESQLSNQGENGFSPRIIYRYQVNGQEFKGDRLRPTYANSAGHRSQAQRQLDRFPPGARVQVFYNPADPAHCALETGIGTGPFILVLVGLLLLGFSASRLGFLHFPGR